MKFKPVSDNVLVVLDKPVEKTESGIFLPSNGVTEKDSQARTGVVVAVGDGYFDPSMNKLRPMMLKVGQRVVFTKFAGTDLRINGEDMIVLGEYDIQGIIEE